ncbi:hypothetical protein EDB19DRAFT_1717525 [Suillus lakei]|nr:hypothetical protein EDB19DRAFT_1717525 [Suillus lakei]
MGSLCFLIFFVSMFIRYSRQYEYVLLYLSYNWSRTLRPEILVLLWIGTHHLPSIPRSASLCMTTLHYRQNQLSIYLP